jgi:Fur family zinc uptake transcriptional regulator
MPVPQTASDPHQNSSRAARALAEAETICRTYRVRLTPIRRRVLEALHAAGKPLGAYELAESLAPGERRMAPITVYRALDFLIEQGLAHRLASRNAYIPSLNGSGSRETTAFLICEECNGVDEVTATELGDTLAGLLNRQGFQPSAKVLEVKGRCSRCQGMH